MKDLLRVVFLFFLLGLQFLKAQSLEELNKKFDSIYFDTATNVSGRDINRAREIADSLYQNSVSDLHKVKSLMLISNIHLQKGENEKAIEYALMADSIAVKSKMVEWQARISGFLSTQYRRIGLYNSGKVYLEKGLNISKSIADENQKNHFIGMVYQEMAYYESETENYLKAKEFVYMADEYFNKLPDGDNKKYFLGTNEELSGRIYINLQKYDMAIEDYYNALCHLEAIVKPDAVINGFIYSGLGRAYLAKNDYENTNEFLLQAEKIAENSDFVNLKLEVYKTLSDFYKAIDDDLNYSLYNEKYIEVFKLNEKNKNKPITDFIDTIEERNRFLVNNRSILIVVSILLILIFVVIILIYRKKKKAEFERFKAMIADLKQKNNLQVKEIRNQTERKGKKRLISPDVEEKILKRLQEFEEDREFTNSNISLPMLAGMLETNIKYLSHILKKHKGKDFNGYINDLRIKYIVNKIENDSKYKKYKISYLAEECGFSSHSKFSSVFKSVTGFTPSVFIDYIEKTKK